ncbi:hypothetical protein [Chromobacterium sp. ASV23]|uniref:hypothetical protein n=1 Tax=Chromobacterium sp. ASV23 TaxID=2795110 RepID=UPI0018EA9F73|nr:hypothetical protein [Chromobacterium sp. ASV23]
MPDTKNVKIGVCQVIYDGVDLGYTKGGVEVSVTTETHKVQVDQFGKSTINELVMGREVKAKCPLAETTIDNLVRIMPGATKVGTPGKPQTTTVAITDGKVVGRIVINGRVYEQQPDATPTAGEMCLGLVAQINADATAAVTASTTADDKAATASVVLTGKANVPFEVSASSGTVTKTQTSAPDDFRVDVTSGIGLDLLTTARELRLHPVGKAKSDTSEDFVIPLAATGGALQFAYKLEEERIYQVEFSGYPHPSTGRLFYIGNAGAIGNAS